MPKMAYTGGPENVAVLKTIADRLEAMLSQDAARNDANERIQEQLATINEDENLKPGERRYRDG